MAESNAPSSTVKAAEPRAEFRIYKDIRIPVCEAELIEVMKTRADDIFVCSFPRSGSLSITCSCRWKTLLGEISLFCIYEDYCFIFFINTHVHTSGSSVCVWGGGSPPNGHGPMICLCPKRQFSTLIFSNASLGICWETSFSRSKSRLPKHAQNEITYKL